MFGTRQLLELAGIKTGGRLVTEDRLRHALRRGLVRRPAQIGGRFVWSPEDVEVVASVLGAAPTAALVAARGDRGAGHRNSAATSPRTAGEPSAVAATANVGGAVR